MPKTTETIVCQLPVNVYYRTTQGRAWLEERVAEIDVGDAELIVRSAEGRMWVVHSGRTPLSAYSSDAALAREVANAIKRRQTRG